MKNLKILWFVPPAEKGGFPNIGQYRFYKNMPVRTSIVYPYLAAMGVTELFNAGFNVRFMDCPTMSRSWSQVDRELKEADLIIMEARTPILKYIFGIADSLRSDNSTVALYGDHVTWDPSSALKHCNHVIMGGDYDFGAWQLAEQLEAGKIPEPIFNAGLVEDLDSLPHVNRSLVPWQLYYEAWRNRDTFVWSMSGRGCFYRCKFCAWTGTFWHNRARQRSPEDVFQEFKTVHDELGDCEILDDHDCFNVPWGVKLALLMLKNGFTDDQILWGIQTHSNFINDLEGLKLMRKAGLRLVKLGVESGNQKTLNMMNKGVSIKQHQKAAELLRKAEIPFHFNMMIGWPWETKAEAYHTIEWVKKSAPNQAQFSLVIPYPNTELYEMALDNGWLTVGPEDWDHYDASYPMMKMEGMTPDEVVQLYEDSWGKFYLNWHYVLGHLKTVKNFQDIKQLIRGYRSIRFGHMKAIKKKRS